MILSCSLFNIIAQNAGHSFSLTFINPKIILNSKTNPELTLNEIPLFYHTSGEIVFKRYRIGIKDGNIARMAYFIENKNQIIITDEASNVSSINKLSEAIVEIGFFRIEPFVSIDTKLNDFNTSEKIFSNILSQYYRSSAESEMDLILISLPRRKVNKIDIKSTTSNKNEIQMPALLSFIICQTEMAHLLPKEVKNRNIKFIPLNKQFEPTPYSLIDEQGRSLFTIIYLKNKENKNIFLTYSIYGLNEDNYQTYSLIKTKHYLPVYCKYNQNYKYPLYVNISKPVGYNIYSDFNTTYNDLGSTNFLLEIKDTKPILLSASPISDRTLIYIDLSKDEYRNKLISKAEKLVDTLRLQGVDFQIYASNNVKPILIEGSRSKTPDSSMNSYFMRLISLRPEPPMVYYETESLVSNILSENEYYNNIDVYFLLSGTSKTFTTLFLDAIASKMPSFSNSIYHIFLPNKFLNTIDSRDLIDNPSLDKIEIDIRYY